MASGEPMPALDIEVVYSPQASVVERVSLSMAQGSTVLDAVREAFPAIAAQGLPVGVWGKLRAMTDTLRDKDRVEIYRPLLVDPKEARRQRYQQHKESTRPKSGRP